MNKTWRFLLEAVALALLIAACCYGGGLALGAPEAPAGRTPKGTLSAPETIPALRSAEVLRVLHPGMAMPAPWSPSDRVAAGELVADRHAVGSDADGR